MGITAKTALAVVGLVIAILGGGVVYLSMLDLNAYRADIDAQVEAVTGRDLNIGGDIELHLGLPIVLSATKLRFANTPWGTRPAMATLDRAEIVVAVWPLLHGVIAIDGITVDGLDLLLETDASGHGNWQFGRGAATTAEPAATPGPESSARGGALPISLADIDARVTRSRVTWHNGQTEETTTFAIAHLEMRGDGADGLVSVDLAATFHDAAVTIEGTVGPLAHLVDGGAPYPVALKARTPGLKMSADGTIARPLQGDGLDLQLSIAADDLFAAAKAATLAVPPLPSFTAAGRLTGQGTSYGISDFIVTTHAGDIAGDVHLGLAAPRPILSAALKGNRLDLRQVVFGNGNEGAGASVLPFDALASVDANVSLEFGTLELPKIAAHNVVVSAGLNGGRLHAVVDAGWLGGGSVAATFDADAGDRSAEVHLTTHNVELATVLGAFGVDVLEGGPTDATIDLSGRGRTTEAWLRSASGHVDLRIGPAVARNRSLGLIGGDLVTNVIRTVNPFSRTDPVSRIRCGVVRAPMAAGSLTFERSLAVETDKLGIIASGTIDVARQRLDLAVRTQAREGLGISVASVATLFVGIGGSFEHPTVEATPLSGVLDIGKFAFGVAGSIASLDLSQLTRLLFTTTDMCRAAAGESATTDSDVGLKSVAAKAATAAEEAATAVGRGLRSGRRSLERLFGD